MLLLTGLGRGCSQVYTPNQGHFGTGKTGPSSCRKKPVAAVAAVAVAAAVAAER
jgi:hypothetical protein